MYIYISYLLYNTKIIGCSNVDDNPISTATKNVKSNSKTTMQYIYTYTCTYTYTYTCAYTYTYIYI